MRPRQGFLCGYGLENIPAHTIASAIANRPAGEPASSVWRWSQMMAWWCSADDEILEHTPSAPWSRPRLGLRREPASACQASRVCAECCIESDFVSQARSVVCILHRT